MKKWIALSPHIRYLMKISFLHALLVCVGISFGHAHNSVSQELLERTVTIEVRNLEVRKALSQIERQANVKFVYSPNAIGAERKVSINATNQKLSEVLFSALQPLNITFRVVGGQIMLMNEPVQSVPGTSVSEPVNSERKVSGKVTDSRGEGLPGVSIVLKNSGQGLITDVDGAYSMTIPDEGAVLIFSFVGFVTQEVVVGTRTTVDVLLEDDTKALEEIVVVGYGTQRKTDLTGSVASVDGSDLVKSAATNVTNSLAGRLPGITAVNGNGKPGTGSQITIRGVSTFGDNNALIVVDGIVRSFEQIDPNEIESISILKDASATAVYGSRAANGVVVVTTKRGRTGKPTISYNGFAGIQNPTTYPKLMNGLEYATTKNVARQNMGLPPAFSDAEMAAIRDGYMKETNWYDLTLHKAAFQTQQNVSVNGGTEAVKYFVSAGFLNQNGLYDNLNYKRYSIRSNIDANINRNFSIAVDLDASRRNNNQSSYSPESIFSDIMAAYPYDKLYNPDETIYYTREQHPVEEIKAGYYRDETDLLQATLSMKHELPFIEGLSVSGRASFGKEGFTNKVYQMPILMNRQDAEGNTLEIYPYGGWNGKTALTQNYSDYNTTTLNASLNYKRSIGIHNINAIALYEQFDAKAKNFYGFRTNFPANGLDELLYGGQVQKDANGGSFTDGRRSFVARADYSLMDKYLFEASFRRDGSVAFPTDRKFGFFPAVSAGWKISEENFFKNSAGLSFVENLKIRASYGLVGNDRNVYYDRVPTFQYQQVYDLSNTIISGGNAYQSIRPGVLPNRNVSWESAAITNIGIDGSLWERLLQFEIDFFYKRTSDILLSRIRSIPGTVGATLPAENYAKVANKGVEISLTHQKTIGALNYFVRGNVSYAKSKVLLLDEPANLPDYLLQTGRPLGFIVGYQALGFFQSDAEVAEYLPQFNGGQKAGDVKYADINGDKVIDANDRTIISMDNSTPKILGGLSFGGSFKGFDLAILFQGATKMDKMLYGRSRTFFNGGSHNNFADLLDYWTPENRDAKYPRPWENPNPNNSQESSLYLRDASYLRLKSIDLGYSLPAKVAKKIGAEMVRIYFAGANILLLDKMKMFDPEVENTDGAYYPQQRTLNLGLNLSF